MPVRSTHSEPIFHVTAIFPTTNIRCCQKTFTCRPCLWENRASSALFQKQRYFIVSPSMAHAGSAGTTASLDGLPLFPWMVRKQSRVRKRAARLSGSCGSLRQRPVTCVAVGNASRERDTRTVHRHCLPRVTGVANGRQRVANGRQRRPFPPLHASGARLPPRHVRPYAGARFPPFTPAAPVCHPVTCVPREST
jgi:hypothetical protein